MPTFLEIVENDVLDKLHIHMLDYSLGVQNL